MADSLRESVFVCAAGEGENRPLLASLTKTDSLRESATLPPATVYRQFGIDTKHTFVASGNRPITVLNHGAPIEELV